MKKFWVFLMAALCLATAVPGYTAGPDVMTIINTMKEVHESAFGMVQKMDIQVKTEDKVVANLVAGIAQKRLPTGKHVLLTLLAPDMLRGFSYLYKEQNDMTVEQWIYSPAIRRIRRLVSSCNAYDSFLHTDFTYSDLEFVDTSGSYSLLGEEEVEGMQAYKIEKIPDCPNLYYSKIVTWVSKETHLPICRDYYDIADRLYKKQKFENVFMVGEKTLPL